MEKKARYILFGKENRCLICGDIIPEGRQTCPNCEKDIKIRMWNMASKQKKIYIAGKITGLTNHREYFNSAEKELKKQGHVVVNPSVVPAGLNYDDYMNICTAMLKACDTIYMLRNWKDSTGATIEHQIAKLSGKEIIYERTCWRDKGCPFNSNTSFKYMKCLQENYSVEQCEEDNRRNE